MDAGVPDPAEVLDAVIERSDDTRRAVSIEVDEATLHAVETHLDRQREGIARFFGLRLAEREGAGFLRYPEGGFYRPHRDREDVPSWPGAARRLIAVVAFLNGSRDGDVEGEFSGGALRLLPDEGSIDVQPRTGLLIAFRADLLHEVTAVRDGRRDAVVDWFYGAVDAGR
jgi:predicted 2-oxoglutarate/Fe(II)-dependent dioxygenase YbiX